MSIFGKKKQSIDLLTEKDTAKPNSPNYLIFVILALVVLIQLAVGGYFFLSSSSGASELSTLQKKEQDLSASWQKYSAVADDIKQIKTKLATFNQFQTSYSGLDQKLDKVRNLVPDGVDIDTLTISNKGKTTLTGHSADPADAYQMVDVVKANQNLKNVNLTSVSKKGSSYSFDITFEVNK